MGIRVKLSAQEAKKAVVLGQVVKEGQQLIFVSAVGINSASEEVCNIIHSLSARITRDSDEFVPISSSVILGIRGRSECVRTRCGRVGWRRTWTSSSGYQPPNR
jgi:hypothetical protein